MTLRTRLRFTAKIQVSRKYRRKFELTRVFPISISDNTLELISYYFRHIIRFLSGEFLLALFPFTGLLSKQFRFVTRNFIRTACIRLFSSISPDFDNFSYPYKLRVDALSTRGRTKSSTCRIFITNTEVRVLKAFPRSHFQIAVVGWYSKSEEKAQRVYF